MRKQKNISKYSTKFSKNKITFGGTKPLPNNTQANTLYAEEPPSGQLQGLTKLYIKGQYQDALVKGSELLEQFPNSINVYNIIGAVNHSLGNLEKAVEIYKKALFIKPDYAQAYYNLGLALREQGKLEKAVEVYKKALSIKPDYVQAYNNMGIALREQGKLEKSIEVYKKALSIKPDYAQAYNNMGNALKDQGKLEEAIEAYTKVLSIKPDFAEAWANGAELLERWNKVKHFEIWLKKAFNSFKIVPADLRFMKAKLLWRRKQFDNTAALISDIKLETISKTYRQDYLQLKAKCFEKSRNFKEAYKCFAKSNSLAKRSSEYISCDPENYFQNLKDKLDTLNSSLDKTSKAQSTKNPDFAPVFLVGFPRSGTTLLDTILRSNSKIEIVEEQGMLSLAENFLRHSGYKDFAKQIITQRLKLEALKIYTREFNKHIDTTLVNKVFVDKLPLNLLKAPLIHQLYPNAKFILAVRHPMDTILSCWMQNFKLNSAMANMVDLDRIVDLYCIAMETFKICRTNYHLNVHEIRYEDLINNLETEAKAVVRYLNLQWEPEMERYQDTALKRGLIDTTSYSQVVEPIYKDAQYRWLNYQEYLEQYLKQVKPWISEFGYD